MKSPILGDHSCNLMLLLLLFCRFLFRQRVGCPPSITATSNGQAKFAFGSRLSDTGKSKLKRLKTSGGRLPTRMRWENSVRTLPDARKRRGSVSRDSDEMTTCGTKPVHRDMALPVKGSQLPAPTKVSHLLGRTHGLSKLKDRRDPDEQELAVDLGEFWDMFAVSCWCSCSDS